MAAYGSVGISTYIKYNSYMTLLKLFGNTKAVAVIYNVSVATVNHALEQDSEGKPNCHAEEEKAS